MSVALDNGVIEGILTQLQLAALSYLSSLYLVLWKRIAAAIITNGNATDVINSVRHF